MHNIYVTRDTNFLPVAIIDSSRQGEDLQNYKKVQPEQNYIKFVNYNAASPTRVTAQEQNYLYLHTCRFLLGATNTFIINCPSFGFLPADMIVQWQQKYQFLGYNPLFIGFNLLNLFLKQCTYKQLRSSQRGFVKERERKIHFHFFYSCGNNIYIQIRYIDLK